MPRRLVGIQNRSPAQEVTGADGNVEMLGDDWDAASVSTGAPDAYSHRKPMQLPRSQMRRISVSTWWHKKVFPALWFSFLGLWSAMGIFNQQPLVLSLFLPTCLAVVGFILMWNGNFRLVDEVWIKEKELIVRNGGKEDCFPIGNLSQVTVSTHRRITLLLEEPSKFGREITFLGPILPWPPAEEQLRRAHRLDALESVQRH